MQTIMITALITAILCTISFVSFGQTFSEWFKQKKTRMKYLYKQIAALKVIKKAIEKGNEEAELEIEVEEINMELEYKVAEAYLTSLGEVNPAFFKKDDILGSIQVAQAAIKIAKEDLPKLLKSKWLNKNDKSAVRYPLERAVDDLEQSMRNLRLLITDGKVQMEDEDRWAMIDGIDDHIDIVNKYIQDMLEEAWALVDERQEEKAGEELLKAHLQ